MRQPPAIAAFGGGGFRVGPERIQGGLLILQDVARAWPVASLEALRPEDLAPVLAAGAGEVEFLLLGTGVSLAPAPRPVREALRTAGLGLEVMNTPEACRLYNFLAGEGRLIAAALIPV